MPELPEVETVRRGLAPVLVGARIEEVEMRRADIRFPFPPRFRERLTGKRIEDVAPAGQVPARSAGGRRDADRPSRHVGLVPYRGGRSSASSTTRARGPEARPRRHPPRHRQDVTFNDPRRFGFMDLARDGELKSHPRLAGLGDEPLAPGFDAARLAALFAAPARP